MAAPHLFSRLYPPFLRSMSTAVSLPTQAQYCITVWSSPTSVTPCLSYIHVPFSCCCFLIFVIVVVGVSAIIIILYFLRVSVVALLLLLYCMSFIWATWQERGGVYWSCKRRQAALPVSLVSLHTRNSHNKCLQRRELPLEQRELKVRESSGVLSIPGSPEVQQMTHHVRTVCQDGVV